MIDQEHNLSLYGLSSRGFELAERYRDDAQLDHLPAELQQSLNAIADTREGLMERFRRTVVDEGGLPKAGNPEREWLENLVDRWFGSVSGIHAVIERLTRADAEWLEEIRRVEALDDWPPTLQQALEALAEHVEVSKRQLQESANEAPSSPA